MKYVTVPHVLRFAGISTDAAHHTIVEDVAKHTGRVSYGGIDVRFDHMLMSTKTLTRIHAFSETFPAVRAVVFKVPVHEKIGKLCGKFVYGNELLPEGTVEYVYRILTPIVSNEAH